MNPRTPEVELPDVAEMRAETPRTAQPEQEEALAACDGPGAESFLFDDPYWDDAFDSYHDPTLRTCCRS